ncbi:MAG: AEC family transporter [Candidatus Methylomirabilia bacterium]
MSGFFATVAFLLIGVGLRRLPAFPRESAAVLNNYVIYVPLPALVLLRIPGLAFAPELLTPALLPWAMLLVSAAGVLVASRLLHWERAVTGSLLLLVPLGNTSFFGIPMVKAFFGDGGVPYAVIYDQLGSFPALATYGSLVVAVYGSGERPTARGVGLRIATFPPFIALVLALALRGVAFPAAVSELLATLAATLAATLVPVVMIAVGLQLSLRIPREEAAPLALGLAGKLVAAPALALLACRLLGLDGEAVRVAVFESGMPPMVSGGALAIMAGLAPSLSAALVGFGILASFLTLPVLFRLLG